MDVSALEQVDVETGTAHVFVDETGENRIVVVSGANDGVDVAYADRHLAAIASADCLLLQNEIPVPTMGALLGALESRDDRPVVVLDPAPPEGIAPLLGYDCVDYATPNEHEYETLAASGALDTFEGTVVQTRGGADLLVEGTAGGFDVTPPPADPVDTTGAGDAFDGCFGARLAAGDDLRSALSLAAAAGALATEAEGAQSAPDIDTVRERARD